MALTLSAASIVRSGGPYMFVQFSIILDGAATTATDLALPAGFPNIQALLPAATGLPLSYTAQGPVVQPAYVNALGGTATGITATRLIPGTAPATQLTMTVSGAGSAGQTVNVLALVPNTF